MAGVGAHGLEGEALGVGVRDGARKRVAKLDVGLRRDDDGRRVGRHLLLEGHRRLLGPAKVVGADGLGAALALRLLHKARRRRGRLRRRGVPRNLELLAPAWKRMGGGGGGGRAGNV